MILCDDFTSNLSFCAVSLARAPFSGTRGGDSDSCERSNVQGYPSREVAVALRQRSQLQ